MNSSEEQLHSIALTLIPGIGRVGAKRLVEGMRSAVDVFRRRAELPSLFPDIGPRVLKALDCPEAFARAEREMEFLSRNHVRCLTWNDADYPSRLRECADAPVALFYKGSADLNALRVINMVGTRKATAYGAQLCSIFLRELKDLCPDVLVVSGLAYGIDICAHREALAHGLPTVGVLAHGLDRIYPDAHRSVATDMVRGNGGLLSEFFSGTQPDRYNFIGRNRIVAGMADATIVVESAEKGGSLITAELAGSYHRDCFAFPGRVTDEYSKGCNLLLRDNKASLLLAAEDLVQAMRWDVGTAARKTEAVQRSLFVDLTEEERHIATLLEKEENSQLNMLAMAAGMPVQKVNALLFELEMKGVVRASAGNVYRLL